jgi:hypothetical protein
LEILESSQPCDVVICAFDNVNEDLKLHGGSPANGLVEPGELFEGLEVEYPVDFFSGSSQLSRGRLSEI